MKTLSVKQPFAYLLCANIKDIENRTWKLHEKYKGEMVLIHASAKQNNYPLDMVFTPEQLLELLRHNTANYWCGHRYYGVNYTTSAIIGSVRFVDCVINHPSIWAEKTEVINDPELTFLPAYGKKIYNWVLANPILFDNPILNVKGKLGFWDYDLPDEYVKLINDYDNGKKDL